MKEHRAALFSVSSRHENCRSRGSAGLKILVRLCCVGQSIPLPYACLYLACAQYIEQFARHLLKIAALGDIAEQRGPREIKRTSPGELGRIDGWYRPRCIAETHEHAQGREAVERCRVGVLADRIVDHRHA